MEILLRLKCHHEPTSDRLCSECHGMGYIERWLPMDLLNTLPNANWVIVGRRLSGASGR